MRIVELEHVPRLVQPVCASQFNNLLVSGCSFTSLDFGRANWYFDLLQQCYGKIKSNDWPEIHHALDWHNLPGHIKLECDQHGLDWRYLTYITWPIYCRDLMSMDRVIDCSSSGAGNNHIHHSVIWALETNPEYTPDNTVVVVMWSGPARDDFIVAPESINANSNIHYAYSDNTRLMLTGGIPGPGNGIYDISVIDKIKSNSSRSLESYVLITGLYHYLRSRGFRFLFAWYSNDINEIQIDITQHLAPAQVQDLQGMIKINPTLGAFAQQTVDGSHPTAYWHHRWAQEVLLPLLRKEIS